MKSQSSKLKQRVDGFLARLDSPDSRVEAPETLQRRFTFVRLEFNTTLDQLDIFADVLTQRAEHETGVWLAGLDVLAREALEISGQPYSVPPMVTYLDRGHGAAIRRVRTRLPGGDRNPVSIIRIPRERMVGSGIGSSLIHEVGHQGAALLGLVESLRSRIRTRARRAGGDKPGWALLERWASEIIADFWSIAKLGITSTLGLIGVVSLPSAFVFRVNIDDPHPFPWIRVMLSLAIGQHLYPDPQWEKLGRLWESFYPLRQLQSSKRRLIEILISILPEFARLLAEHRPPTLRGRSLSQVMPVEQRRPKVLRTLLEDWQKSPDQANSAPPSLAVAVLGQGRSDGRISPKRESTELTRLLTKWALEQAMLPHDGRRAVEELSAMSVSPVA